MPDEKTYTEAEVVERERQAALRVFAMIRDGDYPVFVNNDREATEIVAKWFPLPPKK